MIIDHIRNASLYYVLGPRIEAALRYLESNDFNAMEPGRYEIGEGCYALVQQYTTGPRETKCWEAHRKYIDVQFVANGIEQMGYANLQALSISADYDDNNDAAFFTGEGSFVGMSSGTFIVLLPEDAHMPGVAMAESSAVRKVVVKVPV